MSQLKKRRFSVTVGIELEALEEGDTPLTKEDAREVIRTALLMLYSEGYDSFNFAFSFMVGEAKDLS